MKRPGPAGGRRGPWWTAVVAGMASYLDAAAIVGTGTGLVLYQQTLGLGATAIGTLSAVLTATIAVGALVGGRLGDRYGRRRVFTVAIALYTAGAALMATASSPPALYVGVAVLGLAVGADLPVSLAMIAEDAPPRHRGKMIVLSHLLWMAGIAASLTAGVVVGDRGALGGRVVFGHLVVAGLVVLALRSSLPESRAWLALDGARARGGASGGPSARRWPVLLRSPFLPRLLATGLFYALVTVAANTAVQFGAYLYVNVAGETVRTASLVGLGVFATGILGTLLFMRVVDRPTRMWWFALGAALHVGAFAVPAVFDVHLWSLVVLGVVGAVGGSLAGEPMYKVWSQELFPTAVRATAQGATMAASRLVAALVAVWTPALLLAHHRVLFIAIAVGVGVAGLVGYVWIARLPRDQESAIRP